MNKKIAEATYDLSFSFCKTNDSLDVPVNLWLNQLGFIIKGVKADKAENNSFYETIKPIFSFNDDKFNVAEKKLCHFLEKYNLQAISNQHVRTNFPTRSTDWPLTYQNKLTSVPTEYIENQYYKSQDLVPFRALLGVIRNWFDFKKSNIQERDVYKLENLKLTLERYSAPKYSSIEMSQQHFNRLINDYPEIKGPLLLIKNFFDAKVNSSTKEKAKEQVVTYITQLLDSDNADTASEGNADYALELIGRYAIIEAAKNDGWSYESDCLNRPASVILAKGNQRCIVTKGAPETIIKEELFEGRSLNDSDLDYYGDRFSKRMFDWDLTKQKSGKQPDIVLVFYKNKPVDDMLREKNLRFVFADAKNNQSGDGQGYIRSAISEMFKYMFSYGHLLNKRIDFTSADWSSYFSLFVTQPPSEAKRAVDIISLDNISGETQKWWEKVSEDSHIQDRSEQGEPKPISILF